MPLPSPISTKRPAYEPTRCAGSAPGATVERRLIARAHPSWRAGCQLEAGNPSMKLAGFRHPFARAFVLGACSLSASAACSSRVETVGARGRRRRLPRPRGQRRRLLRLEALAVQTETIPRCNARSPTARTRCPVDSTEWFLVALLWRKRTPATAKDRGMGR